MARKSFRDAFAKASVARFKLGEPMLFVPQTGMPENCYCIVERFADRANQSESEATKTVLITELQWHQPEKASHFTSGVSISRLPVRGDKFELRQENISTDFVIEEIRHNDYIEGRATVKEIRNV